VTRLELCRIAAKAKNLTAQPASNPFADTADKDVLALNHAGVINGMTATEFAPEGLLTRAQIAKIICALRKL
ncbi:MAG: S-layer homology domain-containing protein, partial [Oscillospiraceae bacterium]|nr:S-layer homology domain-containing protein [Oscillospiraceae bacterium]